MRVGEGVGPVDALDQALRTALKNVYEELAGIELIDFKVRILDTHRGTGAATRDHDRAVGWPRNLAHCGCGR